MEETTDLMIVLVIVLVMFLLLSFFCFELHGRKKQLERKVEQMQTREARDVLYSSLEMTQSRDMAIWAIENHMKNYPLTNHTDIQNVRNRLDGKKVNRAS